MDRVSVGKDFFDYCMLLALGLGGDRKSSAAVEGLVLA